MKVTKDFRYETFKDKSDVGHLVLGKTTAAPSGCHVTTLNNVYD